MSYQVVAGCRGCEVSGLGWRLQQIHSMSGSSEFQNKKLSNVLLIVWLEKVANSYCNLANDKGQPVNGWQNP